MTLDGIHVLVVDDNEDCRTLFRFLLEDSGAEVTEAESVADALRTFARRPPDVVLSDISMPGEDGYALVNRVRSLPTGCGGDVPLIAITGLPEHDRQRAVASGFHEYLRKPVDPDALCARVAALANERRTRRPLGTPSRDCSLTGLYESGR